MVSMMVSNSSTRITRVPSETKPRPNYMPIFPLHLALNQNSIKTFACLSNLIKFELLIQVGLVRAVYTFCIPGSEA